MFPLWLNIAYTLFICVLAPVYLRQYGATNFLWFSDIALFVALVALWFENGLLASMMAIAVVVLEVAWNVDFFVRLVTGANLIGLSDYMFDAKINLAIRALSLFHLILPPLLIWMVYRLGYDSRALAAQTILAWIVLPLCRLLSTPTENVNWVYGFGSKPQTLLPAPLYIALLMAGFPLLIYVPSHFLLKKMFGQ
ncbi:MAG: membrane-associated protein [Acidobacteriota bacterium]|nr:membrane-associated protein [Acidobacteriota bacterium]